MTITEPIRIYVRRRWLWWLVVVMSVLGIAFFVFLVGASMMMYEDPNIVRGYLNDTFVRAQAGVIGAIIAPVGLLAQVLWTLVATGRLPVVVLFERNGVRHVGTWLGSHRLSFRRLALTGKGTLRVWVVPSDPIKRQLVEIRAKGKRMRVECYGTISEEDLALVEAWVEHRSLPVRDES